jgi:PKD repeat protein
MRHYISGKWKEYGGGFDDGGGVMCYYYHALPYNAGFVELLQDLAQDYWLIGKEVQIDMWVQWAFPDHEPDRGRSYTKNFGFMVSVENKTTGTIGHVFYYAPDIGLVDRVGDGVIPIRFKPEDVGLTEPGRWPIRIKVEAFAFYASDSRIHFSYWDAYDDFGQPLYPLDIPQASDSLSLEKDGDRVEARFFAYGSTDNYFVTHIGELEPLISATFVTIADNQPTAAFSAVPMTGVAPLVVAFQNLSQSDEYYPITDTRWYFGDGGTSNEMGVDTYVMHEYKTPGTYTVRCIVTNEAGSSEETKQIVVSAGPTTPLIESEGSYLPQAITSVDKVFALIFKVKNNGGGGNIWLRSTCRTTTRELIASAFLPAYGEITIVTNPKDIAWFCGYVPEPEVPINILFEVGPVGGAMTDNLAWETFVVGEGGGGEEEPEEEEGDDKTKMVKWAIGGLSVASLALIATGLFKKSK